ncbi:3-oxoacyl-ACP reductase FabG [Schaalia sp. ZJ405]|uniref:SDR family NAD(P)-dependent oxidoreductase n=1 Tax=Schaalia sp. ZJ405 TaxID=2709403 RepID=UPI0013EBF828|nr:3-oxoacyl-ACP reductase FabG [Schaalia sp. ZJ405]QPK81261.1 3-oxoacyl-ACP reductase FabG [Schaalia sp. ZJ405]
MNEIRLALVTGAARGIGRIVSERLAMDGMRIFIADVNEDLAQATADRFIDDGYEAAAISIDVTDPSSVHDGVTHIIENHGHISVLVNNAGIVSNTPWEQTTFEEWNRVLAVNLTGTQFMTQAVLPDMVKTRYGRIVNIVSLAGRNGGVSVGPSYAASKAGMIGLTRHYAGKVARMGVTVNAVAPGTTNTEMAAQFTEEQMTAIRSAIPVGRLGEVNEIAAAVAYFASPYAGFTTGAVLDVNGGMYFG